MNRIQTLTLFATLLLLVRAPTLSATPMDAQSIYAQSIPSVCIVLAIDSKGEISATGSGFVNGSEGTVVTNRHVVEGASRVVVSCGKSQSPVSGFLVGDSSLDLVLLLTSIHSKPLRASNREARLIKPGERVYVIGAPFGLEGTITDGLISAVRETGKLSLLQVSAPINPGNSGGPILDSNGDVIGVATSRVILDGAQGIGLGIPVAYVSKLTKPMKAVASEPTSSPPKPAVAAGSAPWISALKFRGLPLGSRCALISNLSHIDKQLTDVILNTPVNPVRAKTVRMSASAMIGGISTVVTYECFEGYLVSGTFGKWWDEGEVIRLAIEQKYGRKFPRKEFFVGPNSQSWPEGRIEIEGGGQIELSNGRGFTYSDPKTFAVLTELMALRALKERPDDF